MISEMKKTQFQSVNDEMWKEVAKKSLRGFPFEKLVTKTMEGIEIHPLYSKEQMEKEMDQKYEQMLGSIRAGKSSSDWIIAQQSYRTDGGEFIVEVMESLEKGNEAIIYEGGRPIDWNETDLKALADLAQEYPLYAFHVKENDPFMQIYELIQKEKRKNVRGVLTGRARLPEGYYLIRTEGADTVDLHVQGADVITELAVSLAKAAEVSTAFRSFTHFENQFFVRFAIDTHFFMEIAKLRAFRVLWQTFASAYGHEKPSRVPIFSETSLRTFSKLDPYVNLLRAGNEAFSAVLGGTDVLTVHPHNILSEVTPSSIRHARNIQLVIKEETFLQYVNDPAGGSYFIDTLTNEIIEKAWILFQHIEEIGGYTTFISSGPFQTKLNELHQERIHNLSRRYTSLVGTNIYADPSTPIESGPETIHVPGRLAECYEHIRKLFELKQPNVVLLTFGELKDVKSRADFVKGFLATAGIKTEMNPIFSTAKEGQKWIHTNDFDYGIICAHPNDIEQIMGVLLQDFPNDKWIDVAGKFDPDLEKTWQESGVSGFIYQGQDQIEKLTSLYNIWKGGQQDAKA